MVMRQREGLIARIRQLHRDAAATEKPKSAAIEGADAPAVRAIEARLAHLEQLVEGLQDSVHRESARHGRLIAELQAQTHPAAMGAALSQDARDRGL